MAHSKMTKERKQRSIEKRYSKKIAKVLDKFKDKTMEELWVELDKLKAQMKVEWDEIQ